MRPKRFRFTIGKKLILSFLALVLLPSIILGLIALESAENTVENQIEFASSSTVGILDQYITSTIEPKVIDATYFATSLSNSVIDVKEGSDLRKRLEEYASLHPENASVFLGTAEGVMVQYPVKELPDGYDPRKRDWYINAESASDVVISDAYLSASGDQVVTISQKLENGSGVIGINLKIDRINELAQDIVIGKEGYAILLGQEKQYISHPTIAPGTIAENSFFDQVYQTKEGQFDYTFEKEAKKMVFTTNELTGWKIAGTIYKNEVDQALSPIVKAIGSIEVLAIIVGVIVAILVTRSITKPLNKLKTSAVVISQGDLTEAIHVNSKDEIGELGNAFNEMKENLRHLIAQVDYSTEQVAAASEELTAASEETKAASIHVAAAIQQIASGAENQTVGIDKTALAIETIGKGMAKITHNSQVVNKEAKNTAAFAEEGEKAVKKSVEQMNTIYSNVSASDQIIKTLYEHSKEINEIINVISGISEQTNLLALNAAIEAARAGEHGKGFAVVAEEVRKLAEQSKESAKQITNIIKDIQSSTTQSVQKMDEAAKSVEAGIEVSNETIVKFNAILTGIRSIAPQIEEMSIVAKGVSEEIHSVTTTTFEHASIAKENAAASESVAASTEEQIASLEEVNASAKSLSSMAEQLQELIRKFSI